MASKQKRSACRARPIQVPTFALFGPNGRRPPPPPVPGSDAAFGASFEQPGLQDGRARPRSHRFPRSLRSFCFRPGLVPKMLFLTGLLNRSSLSFMFVTAVRVLSIVACLLGFAAEVFILVEAVKGVHAAEAHPTPAKHTAGNSTTTAVLATTAENTCGYIGYSDVPKSFGSAFTSGSDDAQLTRRPQRTRLLHRRSGPRHRHPPHVPRQRDRASEEPRCGSMLR